MQSDLAQHAPHKRQYESPEDDAQKRLNLDRDTSGNPVFHHEPLDHSKGSIRLLKILPDLSAEGIIQCKIWPDDVNAQYDCLSYVWGPDDNQRSILVNGESHWIRKNLYDFLNVTRTKYAEAGRFFWIDALCIDQSSIAERNHQVAQMGSIYSNAQEVFIWLGLSEAICRVFAVCLQLEKASPQTTAEAWKLWGEAVRASRPNNNLRKDWRKLAEHPYWKRAWIAQEVFLARRHTILINSLAIEPVKSFRTVGMLLPGINKDVKNSAGRRWEANMRIFNTYMETLCGKEKFVRQSLINLLHKLPKRESQIPRDRIYSLLSLVTKDDVTDIPVDYASSDLDFFLHILGMFKDSMCLCLWSCLANALYWQSGSAPNPPLAARLDAPIIRIPLNLDDGTLLTSIPLGVEWPKTEGKCSLCALQIQGQLQSGQLLCLRQLCHHVADPHWMLLQDRYSRDSYTIRKDAWNDWDHIVIEIKPVHVEVDEREDRTPMVTKITNKPIFYPLGPDSNASAIYLTAGALTKLLHFGREMGDAARNSLELCSRARTGDGLLQLCNDFPPSEYGSRSPNHFDSSD